MSSLLEGETAVVTGGASGIGRSIALRFAVEGADIVIADRRREPREGGRPTHERITEETGSAAQFIECDVTDNADLESAVDASREFGDLSIMVNNAGIYRQESFLEVTEDEYEQMMEVNVKGVFFGAQIAASAMLDGGGSIINMSSMAGISGGGDAVTYCTSKGAVRLLTYSLADALGDKGIRVNALHPGQIQTTMTTEDVPHIDPSAEEKYRQGPPIPLERVGNPEDVADAALFLASDLAGYVTGASIPVDGGIVNTL